MNGAIGRALAARSLTRAFVQGTIPEYDAALEKLAAADLTAREKAWRRTTLATRLREVAAQQAAEITKHAEAAKRAAAPESPAAKRRAAILDNPERVELLRSLFETESDAQLEAFAADAVEAGDYAAIAALTKLVGRELGPAAQRAVTLRTAAFERAAAEAAVCQAERARLLQALDFAVPDGQPQGLEAANAAREVKIEELSITFDEKRLSAAYAAVGVDMQLAMPTPPAPAVAASEAPPAADPAVTAV
jgi:hypothetical protein